MEYQSFAREGNMSGKIIISHLRAFPRLSFLSLASKFGPLPADVRLHNCSFLCVDYFWFKNSNWIFLTSQNWGKVKNLNLALHLGAGESDIRKHLPSMVVRMTGDKSTSSNLDEMNSQLTLQSLLIYSLPRLFKNWISNHRTKCSIFRGSLPVLAEKICSFKSGDWQQTTKSTVGQILRRLDVLIRVRSAHGQAGKSIRRL